MCEELTPDAGRIKDELYHSLHQKLSGVTLTEENKDHVKKAIADTVQDILDEYGQAFKACLSVDVKVTFDGGVPRVSVPVRFNVKDKA